MLYTLCSYKILHMKSFIVYSLFIFSSVVGFLPATVCRRPGFSLLASGIKPIPRLCTVQNGWSAVVTL